MSKQMADVKELQEVFTERELRLIKNCMDYASNDPAGMPGHNLAIIIDKMVCRAVCLNPDAICMAVGLANTK